MMVVMVIALNTAVSMEPENAKTISRLVSKVAEEI